MICPNCNKYYSDALPNCPHCKEKYEFGLFIALFLPLSLIIAGAIALICNEIIGWLFLLLGLILVGIIVGIYEAIISGTSGGSLNPNTIEQGDEVVYFIREKSSGRIKIGYSKNFKSRINSLKTSSPGGLEILLVERGDLKREAELHQRFKKYRQHGEWFDPGPEILKYINASQHEQVEAP